MRKRYACSAATRPKQYNCGCSRSRLNPTDAIRQRIPRSIAILSEHIKFEHTIFALPFAYLGSLLAAGGFPPLGVFFWVTIAMAAARTASMSLNRHIDARNPRTARRPIPAG